MQVEKTPIEGPLIIKPDVFEDDRGYFFEQYNEARYREFGITLPFVQDNCSFSTHGAVRGLHYQIGDHVQGKLATAVHGKILDVAVDIRFGSPTFGQHVAVELSSENHLQFWVPPGFAHGVAVLSETAVLCYKCTAFYSPENHRAILYSDTDLKIDWKVTNPVVSEKDAIAPPFESINQDFIYDDRSNSNLGPQQQ